MRPSSAILALLLLTTPAAAQQRQYLVEVGAAGVFQGYDDQTDLKGGSGGLGRLGIWLPLNLSLEGQGWFTKPKTETADVGVTVKSIAGALLYNVRLGTSSSAYLKAGVGATTYGGDCPESSVIGSAPCGSTGIFLGGLGFRVGITPTLMARVEGQFDRGKSARPAAIPTQEPKKVSNFGANIGLSLMLGSKKIVDSDGDGVLDSDDHCPGTPAGALADSRGCPTDSDGDEVADGLDRCPGTAKGVGIDAVGCPRDSDKDGVSDGVDKCADSPAGTEVDASGCPWDGDRDGILDGLDRCPDTPEGATVDALGCPGDEDGDGVLDGLDRCPRTAAGTTVNAFGCPPGEVRPAPGVRQPPTDSAAAPQAGEPAAPAARVPSEPIVLRNAFVSGSARLQPAATAALDSVAALMLANPTVRWEVGGHTDASGTPADNRHVSTLRAEAVRSYLVSKGVPFQSLSARGFGSTQPAVAGNTAQARAANRRVEIRALPPEP